MSSSHNLSFPEIKSACLEFIFTYLIFLFELEAIRFVFGRLLTTSLMLFCRIQPFFFSTFISLTATYSAHIPLI